jgi:hypothetical protein
VQHHDRADVLTADADLAIAPDDAPVVRRVREIRWRRALPGPHREDDRVVIYLALGDSISIDDYTGVRGGGAASQLARKLGLDLVDLTRDGNTTRGVIADLAQAPAAADVVTLTAGGNDLLGGDLPRTILHRLHQIAVRIQSLGARAVINTIYDPSDGDNEVGRRELGLSRLATIELRRRLNAVNRGIAKLTRERASVLADLSSGFSADMASHRTSHRSSR